MSPASIPTTPESHPSARHHGWDHAGVRLSPVDVDPRAGIDDMIAAAVRMIVATHTAPGDRVALADAATLAARGSCAAHRDRLIETVLRLGRGATNEPPRSLDDALPSREVSGPGSGSRSGSGLGPRGDARQEPVRGPTVSAPALIVFGCTRDPAHPRSVIDWAPHLAPRGTLVVLTHSNRVRHARTAPPGSLCQIAALADLELTDRLILAYRAPSTARQRNPHEQRTAVPGGHHRLHTTAHVFRPGPEGRDA